METTRIPVGRWTFDVRLSGPETGRPVLLLHGFPQTSQSWDAVAGRLVDAGLRTVAPDQRGYSPGARPTDVADYRLPALVDDTVGLLDALGLPSADVVGHDWGAIVAWYLAITHPDRVRTLTAVSVPHPAAYGWALTNDADQQRRSTYVGLFRQEGRAEQLLLEDGATRLTAMFAGIDPAEAAGHVRAMSEPGALTAALSWYRAVAPDDLAAAGEVTVPTTYVWSTEDLALGRAGAQRCGDHVAGPYRFVELDGVSHWIPEQTPDALTEAILDRLG